ncbi:MAG: leucine-rich repeat domain-containing protein [Clostridia bacterium]|nr:leucine-rich repeat domain-containing protein [Clostridia bacterium]
MKRTVAVTLIFLVLLSFASCANENSEQFNEINERVSLFEGELNTLKQQQSISEQERQKQIDELKNLIDMLDNEQSVGKTEDTQTPEAEKVKGFIYTVSDNLATITGYMGADTDIVIPTSIDGYQVVEIGDNAFSDKQIKSVIIPDGVKRIGWFAFNGCMELTSATVPSSVTEIGYSAFGNAGSRLTIYCHEGSYIHSFAKSFGLTYALV